MKRKIIFFFFAIAFLSAKSIIAQQADDDPISEEPCLVVWQKDGSQVLFRLAEEPKITIEGDTVVIGSLTIVKYAFQAIKKTTYLNGDLGNRIKDIPSVKERPFRSNGETITFQPSDKDMHVMVVLTSGLVAKDFIVEKGKPESISLTSYGAKHYLINVDDVTYKISIR